MRRWVLLVIIGLVSAVAGATWFFISQSKKEGDTLRTVTLTPRTITQDITFTGRLSPTTSSDVSFELPGSVTDVYVAEGNVVEAGQALVVLDTSSVSLELAQAQATTVSSQDIKKLALEQAQETVHSTEQLNEETLAKRRQAVRDAKRELDQARQVHQARAAESGSDTAATETAIATLRAAETNYHSTQTTLTETIATITKTAADAADAVETARADYLATTQASRGRAGLSSLEAAQALIAQKALKHTLVAPFAGTVTTLHKTIGEAAVAGQPVVTIATIDQLELVATVTETDAIKLATGMPATITFDALPTTEQWAATVSFLSPAATVIDGLSTYTVKLLLAQPPTSLRAGLTASITVHAAEKENVLGVPRRAIVLEGTKEFVSVRHADGTTMYKPIVTGLIGSDGTVEVKEGLTAGENVVINPGEILSAQDDTNN